ncbi:MAG: efflux RND transporter periplasmic adaptor subunit [Phycisphaerales bacterium]|nr:efflux RND transporter periplasmic adaptor subunit [Phycisphaerales bacterium]
MAKSNILIMWITRTVVGIAVIVLAFAISSWLVATAPRAEVADEAVASRSVLVIESAPVDVARQFTGYGVAQAIEDADVPARVSSTVIRLPATSRAGNMVNTGDLLIELDPTDFQEEVTMARQRLADLGAQLKSLDVEESAARQTIEIAQQDLELVRREFQRVQDAVAQEAAMPREADQVQKQVLAAQQVLLTAQENLDQLETRRLGLVAQQNREAASERMAKERVDRCQITSPIDGFIERIDVSQGENLANGQRVARIIDPRHIEVPLSLPASARGDVQVGNEVELITTGSRTRVWKARVARVSPEDDPSSRTMKAYAEVTQPMSGDHHLAPGAFLRGEVTGRDGQRGWVVPRRSVRKDRILVVRDGAVLSLPVTVRFPVTGEFSQFAVPDRDWVVLDDPLEEGELIVLSPTRTLADGMRVDAVPVSESLATASGDRPEEDRP